MPRGGGMQPANQLVVMLLLPLLPEACTATPLPCASDTNPPVLDDLFPGALQESLRSAAVLQLRHALSHVHPGTPLPPLRRAVLGAAAAAILDQASASPAATSDQGSTAGRGLTEGGAPLDQQTAAAGPLAGRGDGGKPGFWGGMQKVRSPPEL